MKKQIGGKNGPGTEAIWILFKTRKTKTSKTKTHKNIEQIKFDRCSIFLWVLVFEVLVFEF